MLKNFISTVLVTIGGICIGMTVVVALSGPVTFAHPIRMLVIGFVAVLAGFGVDSLD